MPLRERVHPDAVIAAARRRRPANILRTLSRIKPLLAPLAGVWLALLALHVLLFARAFRIYSAGYLPSSDVLEAIARALAPDALLTASRTRSSGLLIVLYTLLASAALLNWGWAIRLGRRIRLRSVWLLLAATALLALPLLVSAGLFSDDVYLYHLYGRIISAHGENPIFHAPSAFAGDPNLHWVYWKDLPSSYGPVWLLLSSLLSGAAGTSITAAVLIYRIAGLALHLATAAAIWHVLRRERPRFAVAGTIFYAWNPLILIEVVANAHNDVLVAQFVVLMAAALYRRAWHTAAAFGAFAIMVKPFAALLLPAVALAILRHSPAGERVRRLATSAAVGTAVLAALSVPFGAGTRLLENIATNPASHIYTNTVWELISDAGPAWFGIRTVAIQHPYLDWARALLFVAGALWILGHAWVRSRVGQSMVSLWVLFCLTACWVWPWYFIPAIALAALFRGSGLAHATALTCGGMLFWATWPPPIPAPFEWLHTWRALVLFGPVLITVTIAPARSAVFTLLGLKRSLPAPRRAPVDVRLQTASS